jgi:hypothetical protein
VIADAATSEELQKLEVRYFLFVSLLESLIDSIKQFLLDPLAAEVANDPDNARENLKAMFTKPMPEKIISAMSLSALIVPPMLVYNMALIYRCALFDAFLADVIQLVLVAFPKMLKSSRTLTHAQIIDFVAGGTVMECIAQTALAEFERLSIRDQLKWIDDKFGIAVVPDKRLLDDLVEIFARRNLIVHAGGTVDQRYRNETGLQDKSGTLISSEPYWKASNEVIGTVGKSFVRAIADKFGIVLILTKNPD